MRVLVRVYRDPFRPVGPEDALALDKLGGNNCGNLLFSDSAVRTLSTPGNDVTCWTLERMAAKANAINERFDHVVFPFANALRHTYLGHLRTTTELLRRLRIPVTVLGIGAQSTLDYDVEPLARIDDDVRAFMAALLDRSPSVGVRGEFTAHYLEHLGFSDVDVIGCPSMFTYGPHLEAAQLPDTFDASSRVALNLTPNRPMPHHWERQLIERHPELTYFAQTRADLRLLLWGGREGRPLGPMTDYPDRSEHPLLSRAATRMHVDPTAWFEDLRGFDFTLGTRIHGNIASVLAGTPAHVLAHDSRTRELSEYFEIPHTRLRTLPEEADLAAFSAGHDYAAPARGHAARFATYTDFLAKHDLKHAWLPGASSTWDERRPDRPLPRPAAVRAGQSADVAQRLGWLKDRQDARLQALERTQARQQARIEKLRNRVAALERRSVLVQLGRRVRTLRASTPQAQAIGKASPARSRETSPVTPPRKARRPGPKT